MSALQILREIKAAARRKWGDTRQDGTIEWGNTDIIKDAGVENMKRFELRNHLEARDLSTVGTRQQLMQRLQDSLSDEQLRQFTATDAAKDSTALVQADIEERGSVYVCGANSKGELGLGDLRPRGLFTVIPSLRGVGVTTVTAGADMCYAITEEHDVYVWGGGGFGRTGLTAKIERKKLYRGSESGGHALQSSTANASDSLHNTTGNWIEPQILVDFAGEECVSISVGLSHCVAMGRGGDCFVWGENDAGQLGLGDFEPKHNISLNNFFSVAVASVTCGANHSVATYRDGTIYTWGHASNGRLGIGAVERLGVTETERQYWPIPQHINTLEPIKQVSCGADHTLAYGASGVWSWGSGSGGKLGLGDTKDRYDPCLIPQLRGKFVMQVVAGTWHSMALIGYPPMTGGGWVHTWGSGYHGQLAQNAEQVVMVPQIVEYFISIHTLIKFIAAGSHHCAVITTDSDLYTWGSNAHGCLGRRIRETDVLFTPTPGYVSGFGVIVGRTGRGEPRSVACGKEFTVVCTFPYTGPDLLVATRLMEEAKIREQEAMLAKRAEMQFKEESVS